MKNISDLIDYVISEASLDARISDGMLNLSNTEHIEVVAETMHKICDDDQLVTEFIKTILNEGKYPDRQAFNKEGWLVTFPSKEYRDAAIKKGTHAISDPTHGRGGMNLYYKRRGKQKRQTHQATTVVQPQTQPQKAPTGSSTSTVDATVTTGPDTPVDQPATPSGAGKSEVPATPVDQPSKTPDKVAAITQSSSTVSSEKPDDVSTPEAPKPVDVPAVDVPVVTTPPEQYSSVSKKFADKKGWRAEPYGEYRDAEGSTVAVVGLSGEVVPIKSVDRDEYKIFAEKNMT
jgi:hypothetical protein